MKEKNMGHICPIGRSGVNPVFVLESCQVKLTVTASVAYFYK